VKQDTYLAYPCQNNLILRDLKDPRRGKAIVCTDFFDKVTAVQFSPNGQVFAVGDEKGKVKLITFGEGEQFIVKKEHTMLAGAVNTIAWTDDGQRLSAAGEGKDMFAKAVLADSGTKIGDLYGPTKTVTSVDIKPKPYRLVMSGENQEVYVFDGAPFKHAKTLKHHTNFVNKVLFNENGSLFASVSSDKTIVIYNTETLEVI